MKPDILSTFEKFARPLQGVFMLFVLLIGAVISGLLELWKPGLGVQFTGGVAGWFRAVPDSYYALLGALSGIYMAAKTSERNTTVKAASDQSRAVDDPDGGKA